MKKRSVGFTLIEVLIVLAIIIAMVIVLIVAINPGDKYRKTRDVGRKSTINQISRALDRYYVGHGEYPYPCEETGPNTCDSVNGWNQAEVLANSGELTNVPDDPINDLFTGVDQESGHSFYIITGTEGTYYRVGTFLERANDEEAFGNLTYVPLDYDCLTGLYNYASNTYSKTSYDCPEGATPAPTSTPTPPPPEECVDTDNGNNPYDYGVVTSPDCPEGKPDICITDGIVHEGICKVDDTRCWISSYHCIEGCVNGVCNPIVTPTPGPTSSPVPFPNPTPSWQPSFPCTSYPCGWCLDSDGGKVGPVKGTLHRAYQWASGWPINENTYVDSCRDAVYLTENTCSSTPGYFGTSTIICYNMCYDGACL